MADKELDNQLDDLFSGQEDPPIRAIELPCSGPRLGGDSDAPRLRPEAQPEGTGLKAKENSYSIKPAEPTTVVEKKRQQDQLRKEEQPALTLQQVKTHVERLSVPEGPFMFREDIVELQWVFRVIRRWLWLIVGCVLLTATSAFVISSRMPPVYSATVTLLVHQAPGTSMNDYTAILTSERLVGTYSQLLTGRPVLEAVIARLELKETPDVLAKRVTVKLVKDTQLIRLSVNDAQPTRAALIANAIAEAFIAQIQALQQERYADSLASMQEQIVELSALTEETQAKIDALDTPRTAQEEAPLARLETILAGYRNTYATLQQNYEQMRLTAAQATDNVIVAETARGPERPVQRRTLYTALAAVVGAMVAVGVAFLLEYLDDTIKTPDDVRQTLGLGTLGAIGRLAKEGEELVVDAQPLSPIAEAFRVLCTNVRFSSVDRPLRTLLVTSPGVLEGKSITVANLAVAMVQAGLRVVAVDADLRRPRLHHLFGLDLGHEGTDERLWWGLSGSLLEGRTDGQLHPTQVEGLTILPSGELPPNPAELMGSQQIQQLLHQLAQEVDVVLIDSPPVLPVADATALAQAVDGVLLVLEAGYTRRGAARQAVDSLRQVGANLVGVVLNAVPIHKGSYYYSYNGYHGNGKGRPKHRPRWRKGPLATVWRLFGRRRKAD
jgi:capsular exopolysaccharide synthesis family protein